MTGTIPYDLELETLEGGRIPLAAFRDKVLLVVNTASRCGFTPQYSALERLHRDFRQEGFSVLGFPCNQFMGQEPGTEEEILEFCNHTYDVSFPMFARVEVNGRRAHPLFRMLKAACPGVLGSRVVKWNFTKFLVARDGAVLARFAPIHAPESLAEPIRRALAR